MSSRSADHHVLFITAFSVLLFFTVLVSSGCGASTNEFEFRNSQMNSNAILAIPGGGGGWINNGLHDPSVSGIDPDASLSSQGIAETPRLITDDGFRQVVEYLVECALPEGETITKTIGNHDVPLHGLIGLAPEWQDGACDVDCQEWVSACLLARTNVSGETVSIWMQADHPALGLQSSPDFPIYEASFFGNLFADPTAQYYCDGGPSAHRAALLEGRTCSHGLDESCGFTAFSDCESPEPGEGRCAILNPAGAKTAADCIVGVANDPDPASFHTITTYIADPSVP